MTVLAGLQDSGSVPLEFWRIRSRGEFFGCFPHLIGRPIDAANITRWLPALKGHPAFDVGWDFESGKTEWSVSVVPRGDWDGVRKVLREELARGSPETRFGLTSAAATLFEWIQAQAASGLEFRLTGVVEKAIEAEALLLECPWERDNFPLFLRLLCDEITRRTNWEVEAVPWIKYGTQHRIWVKVSPAPVS